MSTWPSQQGIRSRWLAPAATMGFAPLTRRLDLRVALGIGCLICILVAEGLAVTQAYLWAAPLIGLLLVAVAVDLPLVPFLGLILVARLITDASLSSPNIRHTGS